MYRTEGPALDKSSVGVTLRWKWGLVVEASYFCQTDYSSIQPASLGNIAIYTSYSCLSNRQQATRTSSPDTQQQQRQRQRQRQLQLQLQLLLLLLHALQCIVVHRDSIATQRFMMPSVIVHGPAVDEGNGRGHSHRSRCLLWAPTQRCRSNDGTRLLEPVCG